MSKSVRYSEKKQRRRELVEEVKRGEVKKDTLPNAAYAFTEERQAVYFSHMRDNMGSDMAYATMFSGSQLDDLKVLRAMKVIKDE